MTSRGPITKATKYVDILIESTNFVVVLLFSEDSLNTFSLLTLINSLSVVRDIENTALNSGSSQHGKAILAAVGSNWVVAIQTSLSSLSLKLLL